MTIEVLQLQLASTYQQYMAINYSFSTQGTEERTISYVMFRIRSSKVFLYNKQTRNTRGITTTLNAFGKIALIQAITYRMTRNHGVSWCDLATKRLTNSFVFFPPQQR